MRPEDFTHHGDTHNGQALQRFFHKLRDGEISPDVADWSRGPVDPWIITEPLDIYGSEIPHRAGVIEVHPDVSGLEYMAKIDAVNAHFGGRFALIGHRDEVGTFRRSRQAIDGLILEETNGCSFGQVFVRGMERHGVRTEIGADRFTMQTDLGTCRVVNCGAGPADPIVARFGGRRDTTGATGQGSGSVGQRSIVVLEDGLPPHLDDHAVAMFAGLPYFIQEVDHETGEIEVFPWLPLGVTEGEITIALGTGVEFLGGNAGLAVGHLYLFGCGTALGLGALYGPAWEQVQIHAALVGIRNGRIPGDRVIGFNLRGVYLEETTMDVVGVSRVLSGRMSGIASASASRIHQLAPRTKDGDLVASSQAMPAGVTIELDGYPHRLEGVSRPGGTAVETVSNAGGHNTGRYREDKPRVTIEWHSDHDRLFAQDSIELTFWGPDGDGPEEITLEIDAKQDPEGSLEHGSPWTWRPEGAVVLRMLRITSPESHLYGRWLVREIPLLPPLVDDDTIEEPAREAAEILEALKDWGKGRQGSE